MRVHVLTACTRPENLGLVGDSLAVAGAGHDLIWHVRFDLDRRYPGGNGVRNALLDQIDDGWVWGLDDDTLVHPDLFRVAEKWALGSVNAVVVGQQRADDRYLHADAGEVRVGGIDVGQALLRRDLIGDRRYPDAYVGDGMLLVEVLADAHVVYVDEPLSYHNWLERRPAAA